MDAVRIRCVGSRAARAFAEARLGDRDGVSLRVASDPADALPDGDWSFDCLVVGHDPPAVDGLALLDRVRDRDRDLPVVLFVEDGSEALASEAITAGVTDYVRASGADDGAADRVVEAAERYRTNRARRLEALLEAARELHAAETAEAVCETVVRTARDVLGLPLAGVWRRAEGERELRPVAVTDRGLELFDPPTFRAGESIAWAVHEAGETRTYSDVGEDPKAHNPDTPVRSELLVPIGDQGVFVSGSREPDAFDDFDVRLAELLALDAAAAMERAEREAALERQNERLDRFASVVSHDLRNPLAVAKASLDLAGEEVGHESLDRVGDALDRMERLVEQLLDLAREGDAVTDPTTVEVRSLATDAWRTTDTGDARLVVAGDRTVAADPDRLRRLFENLFRNAVEHGSGDVDRDAGEGSSGQRSAADGGADAGVTVTVGPLEEGFYVEDDGPGIPVDERERVFEPGHSTAEDGTGFGLATVEAIAAAHGWRVDLTEGTDGGARFEFRV